jgi:hypothetical protein
MPSDQIALVHRTIYSSTRQYIHKHTQFLVGTKKVGDMKWLIAVFVWVGAVSAVTAAIDPTNQNVPSLHWWIPDANIASAACGTSQEWMAVLADIVTVHLTPMTEQERHRRAQSNPFCQFSGDPKKCIRGQGYIREDNTDAKVVTSNRTAATNSTVTGGKGVRHRRAQSNPYCQFSGDPKKCNKGQGKVATGEEKNGEPTPPRAPLPPLPPLPSSPKAPSAPASLPIVRRTLQYCQFSGDPKKCGKGGQGKVYQGDGKADSPIAPLAPPPSSPKAPLPPVAAAPIVRVRSLSDSETIRAAAAAAHAAKDCAARQRQARAALVDVAQLTAPCRDYLQQHVSEWECTLE